MKVNKKQSERRKKNYTNPRMVIHLMCSNSYLLAGSETPGAGGDPTPDPQDE